METLLQTPTLRLEHIVSSGHATPEGQWYDQALPEWVLVAKGSAGLLLDGVSSPLILHAGDYVLIPANLRHRVEWTDPAGDTVWLALHYVP